MALLINQGKQDTTQDNKFNPITAQNVLLEITKLELAKSQPNTLEVTLRVLDGKYKNRFIFDRVTFDKDSPLAWRYRALRSCAGVPYKKDEPETIDIEALLMHKAVKADLSIRKGTNKAGEEQDYQNVTYKTKGVQATNQTNQTQATAPTPVSLNSIPQQPQVKLSPQEEEFSSIIQAGPETLVQPNISTPLTIDDESDWG